MTDVVVIGAGPAGLTLGCYLAGFGIRSLILERAHHPRPHVGESLMPATVRIFREIGFLPVMEAADFPRSGGVVYHPGGREVVDLAYAEFPQQGVEQGYTYHVDRSKLDLLLLKHAENQGCRIVQGASVREVVFDADGRATGVQVSVGAQDLLIPAKLVVDAAGRGTKIGRQLRLRRDHPEREQLALHAWFVDVRRGRRDTQHFTHVYFLPGLRGWAWQAPIDGSITSVGLVTSTAHFRESGLDTDRYFAAAMAENEALARAMKRAARINELKGEANFSYALKQVCGDGWLAIGDAAQFIDPVFSSGVSVAMHTARFASERIRAASESGDFSRGTFLPYEDRVVAGAAFWDEFVSLFYALLPVFPRLFRSTEHRRPLLELIQGEVRPAAHRPLLHEMRRIVGELRLENAAAG